MAYMTRNMGILIFDTHWDIYHVIFKNKISSWPVILLENYLLWLSLYLLAYFVFYIQPQRNLFKPFKLNPNYPPLRLVGIEFLRSFRGIFICSLEEIFINHLVSHGYYQWHLPGIFDTSLPLEHLSPLILLLAGLLLFLWGDFHFYWTHRLLHLPSLYQSVHKYHHESYNPDPFSGLSMHWFESSIYFSSALLLGLSGCPLFLVRVMFKSLIIFPLEGHNGYGSWNIESSNNHYIHHSKFNWNYGSSPLWDHLMRTNYPIPSSEKKKMTETVDERKRREESMRQAKEVGCEMNASYREPSVAINTPETVKGK
jgi:Delta7-sterol 5-desaturase